MDSASAALGKPRKPSHFDAPKPPRKIPTPQLSMVRTLSFSNLERFLAKWRNPKCKTVNLEATTAVPNPRPVDPATGRSISPIVAAALCIKPRGMLTANQAAKVDALKKDWPEFATMRRLAMRFRGMPKKQERRQARRLAERRPEVGPYAMQRFARTAQRDIDAVRNAITDPWSNGQTEGQINQSPEITQTNHVWSSGSRTPPCAPATRLHRAASTSPGSCA